MSNLYDFEVRADRGVTLRRMRVDDLGAFQAYRQDPDVGRYQDWARMDDAEARVFLADVSQSPLFQKGRWSQIGIDCNGVLIGDMGIFVSAEAPEAEVGVTLAADAQGKGLAEIAVHALFGYLFDTLGLERIIAGADKDNARSISLMERLGMTFSHAANGDVDYVLQRPK